MATIPDYPPSRVRSIADPLGSQDDERWTNINREEVRASGGRKKEQS
jgi:hypothetical protein